MPDSPVNLDEYEPLARARLPVEVADFIAGGAEDERTLRRNRQAFDRWALRPRVLTGVTAPRLHTNVLGQPVAMPVLLAPAGEHALSHPEGEAATARAAAAAGSLLIASTASSLPLEAIAAAATGPLWFQLYCFSDRELTASLVTRAKTAGYRAIVLTVDAPVLGRREREIRSGYAVRRRLHRGNFPDGRQGSFDASLTWDVVPWLRELSGLPVVLKGIMCGEDAALAVEHGAAAVIVSNHGDRQLDGAPAALEVLPEVVAAVQGRAEVYLDGGVRRGTDVLTALALGARVVCIGRPYLWALAVDGQQGVGRLLGLLRDEIATALTLCGRAGVDTVDRSLLSAGGQGPAISRERGAADR